MHPKLLKPQRILIVFSIVVLLFSIPNASAQDFEFESKSVSDSHLKGLQSMTLQWNYELKSSVEVV